MNTPRLSVVTPAFNAEATIDTCVASVRAQTNPDLELIVVDDGSSDGTVDAVERQAARDPRVRLLRQENAGPSRARNAGIAAARAPLVGFLDSDDAWLPPTRRRSERASRRRRPRACAMRTAGPFATTTSAYTG